MTIFKKIPSISRRWFEVMEWLIVISVFEYVQLKFHSNLFIALKWLAVIVLQFYILYWVYVFTETLLSRFNIARELDRKMARDFFIILGIGSSEAITLFIMNAVQYLVEK